MGTATGGHPRVYVERLNAATACLVEDIDGLGEDDVRGPSLLPGWTRGHVLTHLARNAEGGTRLLGWARTGIPSCEYESVTARAAAIVKRHHGIAAVRDEAVPFVVQGGERSLRGSLQAGSLPLFLPRLADHGDRVVPGSVCPAQPGRRGVSPAARARRSRRP
jgi:hypothetical protein